MTLRVTHCPVNVAGIPWENVQALRRKGVDARLVVFERGKLHPEADVSLDRHGPLPQRLAQQFAAFAKLAPKTDIFHFYFGLTLIPKSLQFPLLRALRKKSVFHYLGSDIRGKSPQELAFGKRAGRRDRRLLRRDPLGARGARDPARSRPDAVHARAAVGQPPAARRARAVEPREEGDALGDRGVRAAGRRARHRRGRAARRRARALRPGRHRRRPAERRLARHLRARVDGARQARRHLPEAGCRRAQRRGLRHPPARRRRDEGDARRRAAPAGRAACAPP